MNRKHLAALALAGFLTLGHHPAARADSSFALPLTDGGGNPLDLGFFAGGTTLLITTSGHGDLVDSRYQVNPDGSLYVPATGVYNFANPGASYPAINGGDGINHFPGGGSNYDFSGSGYSFAGKVTTDTTDPAAIRAGAVVGTFSATPTRSDWFFIGEDSTITIPAAGDHLYVAVNDTFSPDNHGIYSGTVRVNPVPEPTGLLLFGSGLLGLCGYRFRRAVKARQGSPA